MTQELFQLAVSAVAKCPEHGELPPDAFRDMVRAVAREASHKQSAPIRLLPSAIAKDIR